LRKSSQGKLIQDFKTLRGENEKTTRQVQEVSNTVHAVDVNFQESTKQLDAALGAIERHIESKLKKAFNDEVHYEKKV
jgi:cell fate (sporulation/competence/biofilm development) regulator YlbF (YheA/YmcA/DUF963 family)